ncbi:MAG: hypothetical protein IJ812_07455 [Schwartzia sp.]|nr:hypothetical protein [Schwartzia sp. (in: firmicutes)]MBR1886229.1 hypothetical protein [Schwartzia sp. (in: firmicutes)]
MDFVWEEFSEEHFRQMKRIIVASANDDEMTVKQIGRVSVGDVHIELYLCEEPDAQFTIQRRYFVGCAGRETDAALVNIRTAVEGFSYGEYQMTYKPIQYREDILYDELVRMIEEGFAKAVERDEAGVLRAAVEHPTDFWARAKAAVQEKVRGGVTNVAHAGETSLAEKIQSLAQLPAEEFKAKVLALTGVR